MKKYDLYEKSGCEMTFHARQCLAEESFVTKNKLYTARQGQWIVKPVDEPEPSWVPADPTMKARRVIPVIRGAHIEDAAHFERDYVIRT